MKTLRTLIRFILSGFRPPHTVESVMAEIRRNLETGRVQKVNGEWVVLPASSVSVTMEMPPGNVKLSSKPLRGRRYPGRLPKPK